MNLSGSETLDLDSGENRDFCRKVKKTKCNSDCVCLLPAQRTNSYGVCQSRLDKHRLWFLLRHCWAGSSNLCSLLFDSLLVLLFLFFSECDQVGSVGWPCQCCCQYIHPERERTLDLETQVRGVRHNSWMLLLHIWQCCSGGACWNIRGDVKLGRVLA